jgi:hypothetical protein
MTVVPSECPTTSTFGRPVCSCMAAIARSICPSTSVASPAARVEL